MIELRALTPADWPAWRELRLAALAEAPYAFGSRLADWQGDGDSEERWRARLAIPGSHNVIATLGDRPVGMVSGMPTPQADTVELTSMWVSPAARGKGVGDALVRSVEQWARVAGARELRLAVADGNEAASALYERNGFRYTGEVGGTTSGSAHRERIMARAL